MKLSNLLLKVKHGPVKDLPYAKDVTKQPQLLVAVNAARLDMHTRFPVQLKTITLAVADGVFEYPLQVEYAQTNADPRPKHIIDSFGRPFLGDVIAVQQILDENQVPVPLNTEGAAASWFTPQADTLWMDYPTAGAVYFVEYRARPIDIDPDTVDMDQEVYVPAGMETALLHRIEYEVYCGMNMETSSMKAAAALEKYERACAQIDDKNSLSQSHTDARADRFAQDGWA